MAPAPDAAESAPAAPGADESPKPGKRPPLLLTALLAAGVLVGLFGDFYASSYVTSTSAQAAGRLMQASARAPGLLREVLPQEGQSVEAGEVVARLEDAELKAAVRRAEAVVAGARANLGAARSGVALQGAQSSLNQASALAQLRTARLAYTSASALVAKARADLGRLEGLARQGIVSQAELDAARTEVLTGQSQAETAKAQVAGAEEALRHAAASRGEESVKREGVGLNQANLALAEADLELAQLRLAAAEVKAPSRGVVVRRLLAAGEAVAAGQGVLALMDAADLWVNVRVNESDAERVRQGALATVRFDALPNQRFSGKVGFVAPTTTEAADPLSPSPSPGALRLPSVVQLQVRLDQAPPALRPGLNAVVRIEAGAPARL